jgi:hypothetical protein
VSASVDPTPVFELGVKKGTRMSKVIQVQTNGEVVALPGDTKAKMQIRSSADSPTVLLELTTENAGLLVDANSALVTINLTSVQTAAFTFTRAVYDLDLIYPSSNDERECIVEGKLFVFPSVTQ